MRIPAALALGALLAACTALLPEPPVTGPLPREIVILRAYSGAWTDPAERTRRAIPELALFADGTLVAMAGMEPNRELRGLTLSRDELQGILARLSRIGLRSVDRADDSLSGCFDCATQVIWWNGPAGFVEAAAHGLYPTIHVPAGTPPALIAVTELLDGLADRVRREGQPIKRELPLVPSTPIVGG